MKKILKFLFLTLAFTGFSVAGLAYEAKNRRDYKCFKRSKNI